MRLLPFAVLIAFGALLGLCLYAGARDVIKRRHPRSSDLLLGTWAALIGGSISTILFVMWAWIVTGLTQREGFGSGILIGMAIYAIAAWLLRDDPAPTESEGYDEADREYDDLYRRDD